MALHPPERSARVALARAFEAAVNAHDLAAIEALVSPAYIEHQGMAEPMVGSEAVRGTFEALYAAFPDYRIDLEDVIVDGDRIAMRATQRGTQSGPLGPMPATGRSMEVLTIDIVRVEDGQFAEHWGLGDVETMARQLGWTDGA